MCGLAGFVDRRAGRTTEAAWLAGQARRMADTLVHRGPDDSGVWVDASMGVGLGHRRLSIIDLSPLGAQPMLSANGRYVVAYNGEVYNFAELRAELERRGHSFRGHSDTEVITEGFAEWGVAETARRLLGMFAIAVWDKKDLSLSLIRDRVGVKPLYWTQTDRLFLFGSELKALHEFDGWQPEIDRQSIGDLLAYSCIPAPHSIYLGVHKLEPGRILTLDVNGDISQSIYWDLAEVVRRGSHVSPISEQQAISQLHDLLKDAVKRRMVADVPLGAFLSGGIDSSLVVALMQSQSSRPVKTFTIGFSEAGFDEAAHARKVARHLGTEHTEHYLPASDALALVPQLADMYDEPFADSSQLPTHLVSAITRRHVSVALSGDGGDEVFAGYNRYVWFDRIWRVAGPIPLPLRRVLAAGLQGIEASAWDKAASLLPSRVRPLQMGDKVHKLAAALAGQDQMQIYQRLLLQGSQPHRLLRNHAMRPRQIPDFPATQRSFVPVMQFNDMLAYLPDDILTKVDRASMAVGLEAREPLLDHRLIEFAWSLPLTMKLRGGQGKWILRQILDLYVPRKMMARPKAGFGIPLQQWLCGPLRQWAEALLEPRQLAADGYFNSEAVAQAWSGLLQGHESPYLMWNVLMFQAWKQRWHPRATAQ